MKCAKPLSVTLPKGEAAQVTGLPSVNVQELNTLIGLPTE